MNTKTKSKKQTLPRIFNPIICFGLASVLILTAIVLILFAALSLIWTPFSLFHNIYLEKKENKI